MAYRRRLRLAPWSPPSRELLTQVFPSDVDFLKLKKIKPKQLPTSF
jgi:hypothetical protein